MPSTSLPQGQFELRLQALLDAERLAEDAVRDLTRRASGLVDIDLTLRLVSAKLATCLHVIPSLAARPSLRPETAARAAAALALLDGLAAANVSEDQRGEVLSGPDGDEAKRLLQEFILAGGAMLLEARELNARRRRALSRSLVAAIRKHQRPDDRSPALDPASLPPLLRRIVNLLFPVLLKEQPARPPYGIEEGEERVESSAKMLLPLSQAVAYLEREVLSRLREELARSPGDVHLQREIRSTEERIEEYRRMRFLPRSTPVLLEQGFFTAGMTEYSADGELLVPVSEPVSTSAHTTWHCYLLAPEGKVFSEPPNHPLPDRACPSA